MYTAWLEAPRYEEVPISTLSTISSRCNSLSKATTTHCVHAAHVWCLQRNYKAGIIQESDNGVFGVGCFDAFTTWVQIPTLTARDYGCNGVERMQTISCMKAVKLQCASLGFSGGLPQTWSNGGVKIACVNTLRSMVEVTLATLKRYHSGCDNAYKAMHSPCRSAAHRYVTDAHRCTCKDGYTGSDCEVPPLWTYGAWSTTCNSQCLQTRTARCESATGIILSDSLCNLANRETTRPCPSSCSRDVVPPASDDWVPW